MTSYPSTEPLISLYFFVPWATALFFFLLPIPPYPSRGPGVPVSRCPFLLFFNPVPPQGKEKKKKVKSSCCSIKDYSFDRLFLLMFPFIYSPFEPFTVINFVSVNFLDTFTIDFTNFGIFTIFGVVFYLSLFIIANNNQSLVPNT